MILQALYDYYQRKAADPESGMAPEGWEWKEIPYLVVIDREGRFVDLQDTREGEGKKKRARKFLVPQAEKRTVNKIANLLWDNIEYALGANPRGRDDVNKAHTLFLEKVRRAAQETDAPSIKALLKFLENDPIGQIERSGKREMWKLIMEENPFISFRVDGFAHGTVCDDLKNSALTSTDEKSAAKRGVCLVTGETDSEIAVLHAPLKGLRNANTSGAALVSFNLRPFCSYGKTQNYNAPVSKPAAFAYTTALNTLLSKDSQNKIVLGDAETLVFWAERRPLQTFDLESNFSWYFSDERDDPDRGTAAVKSLFQAWEKGILAHSNDRFYVLGLTGNRGRISVSLFRTGTVREFGEKIGRHFQDIAIVHGPKEREYLSLFRILTAAAFENKIDNLPPKLEKDVIESVLDGAPYPRALLQQCLRRIRAERKVTRERAAILKAYINRFNRFHNTKQKEIAMALDPENTHTGYRLGRLFAVLEKIQEEANPGINATIRDRFYGAASSSPAAVFPQLLKLKNHHLAKLENAGRRVNLEKLIAEIVYGLEQLPGHLTLDEQAHFALGYYHQRQDLWAGKKQDQQENNQ